MKLFPSLSAFSHTLQNHTVPLHLVGKMIVETTGYRCNLQQSVSDPRISP